MGTTAEAEASAALEATATAATAAAAAAMAGRATLQEYIAGHLVERGLHAFEDALNGPVKEGLRTAFPNDMAGPVAEEYAADARQYEEDKAAHAVRLKEAKGAVAAAQQAFDEAKKNKASKEEMNIAKKALSKARRVQHTLGSKELQAPMDVWLRKARSVLGDKTKNHTHATSAWDTFTLVQVVRGFLEEVFVRRFGIDDLLEAKGLLSILLRASEARSLRAHGAMPTESEAVALLHSLAAALRRCGLVKPAQELGSLLAEAQELKRAAAGEPGTERRVKVGRDGQQKLLLYRATVAFEGRLGEEAGRFQYKDGTYALGERVARWSAADQALVRAQGERFKEVAMARHWLFHHTDNIPDGAAVLAKMGEVLQNLRGIAARNAEESMASVGTAPTTGGAEEWPWSWPGEADLEPTISVLLQASAGGMNIPVPQERCLVGRDVTIATVTAALLSGTGARVLVHGQPGMGKDVVAAEVVRSEEVAAAGLQLQAWLQASTDAMLRRQLVDLFSAQLPEVVGSARKSEDEQLEAIRSWLATHDDWLLVLEDATWASTAVWTCIPPGTGRLLVTSQSPLSEDHSAERQESEGGRQGDRQRPLDVTLAVELQGLSVSGSLELLCRMSLFAKAKVESSEVEACSSDMEVQYICAKVREEAKFVYAPREESESERMARHEAIVEQLLGCSSAKAKDRKKRLQHLQQAQLEYRELLQHRGLRQFLSKDLGNVPLLVSFCGHLLRSIGSVDKLIEHHRRVPLKQQQQAGRNPMTDSHYLGAARSVVLLLQRLEGSGEEEWRAGLWLLQALALLPSRTTPASLFSSPDERHVVIPLHDGPPLPVASPLPSCSDEGSRRRFEEARRLLLCFGLAREAEEGRAPAVHQLVQRVVREQPPDEEQFGVVRQCTRQAMESRLAGAAEVADFMDTRAVLPCAVWWCLARRDGRGMGLEELKFQERTAQHLRAEGNASQAAAMQEEVLLLRKRILPPGDPRIGVAMANLAKSYGALGRREEAAAMEEEVFLLLKRILPPDHPNIAMAMGNLASSYAALGRREEAAAIRKEALQLMLRSRPPDHRNIAVAMGHLASSYFDLGKSEEAAAMQEEVLQLSKRILPPDHPGIATDMANLAESYGAMGRREEAAAMQEEVLQLSKRILPAGHPDIAAAIDSLASSYYDLGRREEAAAMREEVLLLRERNLPPGHPDIGVAMGNLAKSYWALGRWEEAAALQEETLQLRKRIPPPGHPDVAVAMANLAKSYGSLGRKEEAAALLEEALMLSKHTLLPDHPDIARVMGALASSYGALGRLEEAAAMEEEVLQLMKCSLPPDHPDIGIAMGNLAQSFRGLGRTKEAAAMEEEVLLLRRRILPPDHPGIAVAMNNLAISLLHLGVQSEVGGRRGYFQSAVANAHAAVEIYVRKFPPGHPDTAVAMRTLRRAKALMEAPTTNAERLKAAKARARQAGRR